MQLLLKELMSSQENLNFNCMKNYENYVTVQTFTVLIVSHADKPKKITVGKNDGSVPLSGMIRHHIETLQLVSTFKIKRSLNKH